MQSSSQERAVDLSQYGLEPSGKVHWNIDSEGLHTQAVELGEAKLTSDSVLLAVTGERTGRSPNDRFIVDEAGMAEDVWWGEVNRPTAPAVFERLLVKTRAHLNAAENLFVKDAFCGSDPEFKMPVRLVTEKAWHAAFMHNMFVRASEDEIAAHIPEFTILHAPELKSSMSDGVNSDVFVIIALDRGLVIIGGTHYAGEIKKAIFTIMNHILPSKGLLPMHCSANTDGEESALFFGLSGTGKTTLSADPNRALIGDDEHGWSDKGVFNFEGGCYAKTINLTHDAEPEIYDLCHTFGSIIENVMMDPNTRELDFFDRTYSENGRVSYDISKVPNASVTGQGGHPKNIIMLTCDAFGVLPPISQLTSDQAMYHFLSGYTAKVAGTERGLKEPAATFSTCFGAPFMPRHPTVYAKLLGDKMAEHDAKCWLVNTGWSGGGYGVGERMKIAYTRAMVNAALNGKLGEVEVSPDPNFGVLVPQACPDVPGGVLNPRNTWSDGGAYDLQARDLTQRFESNFKQFEDHVNDSVKAVAIRAAA